VAYVAQDFHDVPSNGDENTRDEWPEHRKLLAGALELLRKLGVRPEAISLPQLPVEAAWRVLSAETGAVFDDFLRNGRIRALRGTGPNERANQLRASRFIPAVEYIQAQRVRSIVSREIERILETFDAVLSAPNGRMLRITSMTGHPSIVLKAGFVNGLPRGMMISGRLYDEATVLHLALAYEQATSWHTMHPMLD
jgi:Asp-tRNA(Asn)/Glu-tRNA(Gln) amidotransferase A subunit family amidase